MRIFFSLQYIRFLLVGGTAAALHWLTRIGLSQHMMFESAVVLSYFVGLLAAFVLNRYYVFPATTLPVKVQIRRFFIVNLITMPLVWITAIGLYEGFFFIPSEWWRESLAHGVAVAIPAVSSFVAYKLFAFK